MGVLTGKLERDVAFQNGVTIEELLGPDDGPHNAPFWWDIPRYDDEDEEM
jgi:hypothetical protein